jgi:transposase
VADQARCTSNVDVSAGHSQLHDVVPGRSATGHSARLEARDEARRHGIRFGVLDLSGLYRKTFEDTLAHVTQVADPFHLIGWLTRSWMNAAVACRTRPSATGPQGRPAVPSPPAADQGTRAAG